MAFGHSNELFLWNNLPWVFNYYLTCCDWPRCEPPQRLSMHSDTITYISAFCTAHIAIANLCNSPPDSMLTFLSFIWCKSVNDRKEQFCYNRVKKSCWNPILTTVYRATGFEVQKVFKCKLFNLKCFLCEVRSYSRFVNAGVPN